MKPIHTDDVTTFMELYKDAKALQDFQKSPPPFLLVSAKSKR